MATNRCDRVIIVSGDDSTGDTLMPWIGAGFAAAGAHAMGNMEEVAPLLMLDVMACYWAWVELHLF